MGGALVAWLAGVWLQLQQAELFPARSYVAMGCGAVLLAVATALWLRGRPGLRAWLRRGVVWAAVGAAGFSWAGWRAAQQAADALAPALEGRDVVATGVVEGLPLRASGGWRFVLAVESAATPAGAPVHLPPRVQVSWYDGSRFGGAANAVPEPRAGERWQMTLRLRAPHGGANPYGFDVELYLWEQGVGALAYVRTGRKDVAPQRLGEAGWHPVQRLRAATRAAIVATVPDARQAGLIAALTLGDQNAIERSDWQIFRVTGIAHLVSISGLHITMFAWLAAAAITGLWRRSPRLALALPAQTVGRIGGVAAALLYALFAGWGVPAQRTVLMLATVAGLRLAGVRWPWTLVWLAAAAVVVAADPWALLQAGFWLSFVAVGILVAGGEQAADRPRPADGAGIRGWMDGGWRVLREGTRTQLLISVALAPLTLLLFQQVSLVGLAANAFAIPWVTFVVTPLALLGVLWPPLWHVAAWAGAVLVRLLESMATWPAAVWEGAAPPALLACAAVAGGVLLVLRLPVGVRACGLALMLPAFAWQPPRPAPGQFDLVALDVGQGSAVVVRTARHSLLYDTGPRYSAESDAGDRVVVPYLRATGERPDRIVVSHVDTDHSGGAEAVLAAHPDALLLASAEPGHALWSLAVRTERCVAGQGWTWDGVRFDVLHPFRAAGDVAATGPRGRTPSTNAQSCVLRVATAGSGPSAPAALLTGDVEAAQEVQLVAVYGRTGPAATDAPGVAPPVGDRATLRSVAANASALEGGMSAALVARPVMQDGSPPPPLTADILLMPHHGSRGSSSAAFIAAVAPRRAVAQAGYLNRYGHPAPAALARYAAAGVPVASSVACGAASWASTAPAELDCWRESHRRYWQHRGAAIPEKSVPS